MSGLKEVCSDPQFHFKLIEMCVSLTGTIVLYSAQIILSKQIWQDCLVIATGGFCFVTFILAVVHIISTAHKQTDLMLTAWGLLYNFISCIFIFLSMKDQKEQRCCYFLLGITTLGCSLICSIDIAYRWRRKPRDWREARF